MGQGSATAPAQLTWFVGPNGRDTASGTRVNQPLATLDAALGKARLRAKGTRATVRLAPGRYALRSTLQLGPADAGITLDGGGKAILDAGVTLDGWGLVPADLARRLPAATVAKARVVLLPKGLDPQALARKGFSQADAPGGRRLLLRGRPMNLARYPNPGDADGGWLRIADADKEPARRFRLPNDRANRWANPQDAWFMGYWQFDWAESWEPATQWDAERRWVTLSSEIGNPSLMHPSTGRRFFVVNVPEELDEPGEWWIDGPGRRVVFWPPIPLKTGDVTMTALESSAITIRDTSDVTVRGVRLLDGSGGAIDVLNSPRTTITDTEIRGFAKYGVKVENSLGSRVTRCHLHELGQTGISLTGGDRRTLTPGNLVATDNVIERFAQLRRTYNPGVSVDGVGNTVAHNRITDAPHNAVLLGGNDHRLEYNDVQRVCTETGDSGAFYMGRNTTMRGVQIRFNRFRDLAPRVTTEGNYTNVMGVYLDDCFAGVNVEGNIFEMAGTGIMVGGGRDNSVVGNIFLGCQPAVHVDERGKGWAKEYLKDNGGWNFLESIREMRLDQPPYRDRYPRLTNILSEDPAKASGNVVRQNMAFGGPLFNLLDGLKAGDVGAQENVDVPATKLTLAQAMAKRPTTWVKIPLNEIGPRPKAMVR